MQKDYFHVINRGLEKKLLFISGKDLTRFVDTLSYYQYKDSPARFSFRKRPGIVPNSDKPRVPLVEIVCFCLMPDHFHLLLNQRAPQGVSMFLSKVTNSYTRYFNARYKRKGPLVQGTFKAVEIENDNDLLNISRHIHLDPLLNHIVSDLKAFPFSSYPHFLGIKEGFCQKEPILSHFKSAHEYENFVLNKKDYTKSIQHMGKLLLEEK